MAEKKLTSWSFSRWNLYTECPRRAKYKFIDKLPEPGSPALERGTQYHLLCEHYLRGIKKTVPRELKLIEGELKRLRQAKALPEAEFTFRQDWSPTRWDDWSGAWVRIKADAVVVPVVDQEHQRAEVVDFKTGKLKDDLTAYNLQLELYALAGLLAYPTAERVCTSLVFIDHGKVVPHEQEFTPKDLKVLQKQWLTRTKKMLNDTAYKPLPGNACRWCPYRKSNDGPCEY